MKSSVGGKERGPDNELVHWCHGAPGESQIFVNFFIFWKSNSFQGWIPLLCQKEIISQEFRIENQLLTGQDIAKKFGECVWTRGLLKKGLGLCHGVGGNGISLFTLYKATGDEIWLRRAFSFGKFGIENYERLKDVPDNPDSLFEGVLGFGFFLSILQDNNLHAVAQTLPF